MSKRLTALLLTTCLVAGVPAEPTGSPTLVKAGKAKLKQLKRLPAGRTLAYYFEIMRGPDESVGYAAVSLTAFESYGKLTYRYTNEGIVRFPTGDQVANTIAARLQPNFEPIEVEMWRERIRPSGERSPGVWRARVGKEKVTVSTGEGERRATREVPRPDAPFIYAIEFLAGQLTLTQGERFLLREFDLNSGGARDLEMEVDVWEDGTATLFTNTPDGLTSYQFWFNQADEVIRWAEASMPVMFLRVSKARLDELKSRFGQIKRPRSADDKGSSKETKKVKP